MFTATTLPLDLLLALWLALSPWGEGKWHRFPQCTSSAKFLWHKHAHGQFQITTLDQAQQLMPVTLIPEVETGGSSI